MKILILDAEIIHPTEKGKANLLIENDRIIEITESEPFADKIIIGDNLKVSSGWFDMNCFAGDPGLEYKEDIESLVKAASAGGYTEVVVLPNTQPVIDSKDVISYILSKSLSTIVSLHPVGAVTIKAKGNELSEMIDLHNAGAIALSDGIQPIWHSDILLKALQYNQRFGGLVIQRPEDPMLSAYGQMNEGKVSTMLGLKGIPNLAEDIMVKRDLRILEYTGGRLHFSMVSTPQAIMSIREAKSYGLNVTCDMAAYHLFLDDENVTDFDTNYKVNPPLRTASEVRFFQDAVRDGTIDAIVSGHRPQEVESKELEFDLAEFGMIGLETSFSIANAALSKISLKKRIDLISYNPRKILNLKIPEIKVGANANLTVFDPYEEWVMEKAKIKSKSKNSPFIGKMLKGKIKACFNKGQFYIND